MNIRKVEYKDLQALVEIYNQAIVTHRCTADMDIFTTEEKNAWLKEHQSEEYPMYIYEIEGKVVGYVYFSGYRPGRRAMRYAAEISYYIHKDYQKKGIGSQLMKFAIEKGRELKFKHLIAILLSCNEASIKLLDKFGFEQWGSMPDIADFDGSIHSHLYYGLKL